ncbi:MAG: GYF domain-containing protein [Saprospiraceae bacterium]
MNNYFVHIDGSEKGPFSFEDLKALNIDRNTMVWYNGLDKWVKAEHVEELKPLFAMIPPKLVTPPPFPGTQVTENIAPPVFTSMPLPQNRPVQSQSNMKYWPIGFILLLLIGLGIWYFTQKQDTPLTQISTNEPPVTAKSTEKKQKQYRKVKKDELEGAYILNSNGGKVNVKQSPDMNAPVLYQLNKGEEVLYLDEKTDFRTNVIVKNIERENYWYKVQPMENADVIGWVHGDFLNFPGNFPR